jgi:preprotein translocase subunit SecD
MRRRLVIAIVIVGTLAVLVAGVLAGRRLWRAGWAALGGVVIRYRVDVAHRYAPERPPSQTVRDAAEVLRNRLRALDMQGQVDVDGERLRVTLIGVAAEESLVGIGQQLGRSGRLEFKLVDDGSSFMEELAGDARAAGVSVGDDVWQEQQSGAPHRDRYLTADDEERLRSAVRQLAPKVPADHQLLLGVRGGEADGAQLRTYYVRARSHIDNDDITDAELSYDATSGRPEIALAFGDAGAQRFEQVTRDNVGRKLAIVLENRVDSAPVIETALPGGHARITVGAKRDPKQVKAQSEALMSVLRAGGLPAPLFLEGVDRIAPKK